MHTIEFKISIMKHLLLILFGLLLPLTASADFPSIAFTTITGDEKVISADGLEITFSNGNMTATSSSASFTIPLTQIASMQFSNKIDASVSVSAIGSDNPFVVYTPQGICRGTFSDFNSLKFNLEPGIYIIRSANGETSKISISK